MSNKNISIIEPKQKLIKSFESTDDFDLYYSQHKDEMDVMTTQKLNKCYPVNGYHICRIHNALCLKKVIPKNITQTQNNEIESLKAKVSKIEQYLHDLSLTVQTLIENKP